MSVRAALGASRWRLVRQLLTETTVLGLAGGLAGVLLANWALWGLLKLPQNFISVKDAAIDSRVFFFALAISVFTGWLFGLVPALQLSSARPVDALKQQARGASGSARAAWVRRTLVVSEIALACILLVVSFIDFGLTQVLFSHHLGNAFYALGISMLAGACIMLRRNDRVEPAAVRNVEVFEHA